MSDHIPVYWTCPNCGVGGEKQAHHLDCGGALYRDPDRGRVYCSTCGADIDYFVCDDCGRRVNME